MPWLIDTHAHLNLTDFDGDRDKVIQNSLSEGIFMINVGVNYESSRRAVEIAEQYQGVWSAIGLHALNMDRQLRIKNDKLEDLCEAEFDPDCYRELAKSKKVKAIGEIGLDYYYKPKTNKKFAEMKELQMAEFKKQIIFSRELGLPLIFHCRMAHNDMIEILKQDIAANGKLTGVVHCFTGGMTELREYLDMGFHIGLNGIIFKMNLDEAIKNIPAEMILLETDCPYLSPSPDIRRNEPKHVEIIARRVAQIRGENLESIIEKTTQNALELFNLGS